MTRTAPRQCDSEAELGLLSPTDNLDTNINADSTLRMADVAATLSLLLGVPLPRHNEGAFLTRMFRNVRRERWPLHMQDLLYQRWWYTQTYLQARGAWIPTRRRFHAVSCGFQAEAHGFQPDAFASNLERPIRTALLLLLLT